MLWWILTPAIYLTMAFLMFRHTYTKGRADTFVLLAAAQRDYEERLAIAKANYLKENPHKSAKHVHVSDGDLKQKQRWVADRIDLGPAVFIGLFWFLLIFKWLAKGAYWVLFRGDIDKAAVRKSKVLIAQKTVAIEAEKEKVRLLELAKEEGLLKEES